MQRWRPRLQRLSYFILQMRDGGRWRRLCRTEEVEYDDWPLSGPRTLYRDLRQLRRLGFDFVQHHESWIRKSQIGVSMNMPQSAAH